MEPSVNISNACVVVGRSSSQLSVIYDPGVDVLLIVKGFLILNVSRCLRASSSDNCGSNGLQDQQRFKPLI